MLLRKLSQAVLYFPEKISFKSMLSPFINDALFHCANIQILLVATEQNVSNLIIS